VVVLFLAVVASFVAKRYILSALTHIISMSKSKWDDAILRQRTLNRLANLAPAMVIYGLTLGRSITYRIAVGPQQGRKVMTLQTLADCGDDQFTTRVGNVAGFSLPQGTLS
jgi:hypothetical protein